MLITPAHPDPEFWPAREQHITQLRRRWKFSLKYKVFSLSPCASSSWSSFTQQLVAAVPVCPHHLSSHKSYWDSSRSEAGATLVHTQEESTSVWLLCLHQYATVVPGSLSAGLVPAECVRKVTPGNSPAIHNIAPLSEEAWLKIWNNYLESGHEKGLQPQKLIQTTIMLQMSLILDTLINEENLSPHSDFFIPVNYTKKYQHTKFWWVMWLNIHWLQPYHPSQPGLLQPESGIF